MALDQLMLKLQREVVEQGQVHPLTWAAQAVARLGSD